MTQYISKSPLVEEINRIKGYYERLQALKQVYDSHIEDCNYLLSFLDTLEVEEDYKRNKEQTYKESEDEKVRKKLIHLVKKSHEQGGYALHKWESDEMLAWLEKQGEQKSAEWSEKEQQIIKDAACFILSCVNTAETKEEEKRLEELADKLQDLRPQKQWKPSEEQMKRKSDLETLT